MPKKEVEPKYSLHHIIPQSRKPEGFDISHELNLKRLRHKFHQRIHGLYDNLLPHEQMEQWLQVNQAVLTEEVRRTIQNIVTLQKSKFYRAEVLKEPTSEKVCEIGYKGEQLLIDLTE